MLVLNRKPGQRIFIGDNITVTLVRIGANTARIGIEAPKDTPIVREEIAAFGFLDAIHAAVAVQNARVAG